jgi:hypothetical protein
MTALRFVQRAQALVWNKYCPVNVDSMLPGGSRPLGENLPPGWRLQRS